MGNSALTCCRRRGTVRLVLLSGDIAEFKEPVKAATVMKKYPRHIILHCCMASSGGGGQRRQIAVLGPEQSLRRKENYLLTPIQSTTNAKSFLDSWAFFTLNAAFNKRLNAKIRQKSSLKTKCWIQNLFDKIFKTLPFPDMDATKPLLDSDQHSIQSSNSKNSLRDWRPSLDCIQESPTPSSHSAQLSRSSSLCSYPRLDFC